MDPSLPPVAEELLQEIQKSFRETSQISDELLLALRFVFGTSVVAALDLVDRQSVTRFVSPSGRTVYQVVGSSGKLYTCYSSCHFCSCPAFAFSVLRKGDNLVKKSAVSTMNGALPTKHQSREKQLGRDTHFRKAVSSARKMPD